MSYIYKNFVYALVDKRTGKIVKNYSGRGGSLYLTKNGPSQMLLHIKNRENYEIVKYEIFPVAGEN